MKNSALTVAGLIFLLVSGLHFYRYAKSIHVVFGQFTIPQNWSLYGGSIALLLAVWMFYATKNK